MKRLTRETNETRVTVAVDLNGGPVTVTTDDDFLTHMVVTLARYAGIGLQVKAVGDLRHHLVEEGFAGPDLLRMSSSAGSVEALGDALSFIAAAHGAE